MGYVNKTLEEVINLINKNFTDFSKVKMLELGDQKNWEKNFNILFKKYGYDSNNPYTKFFFEKLGVNFTSIDYLGTNGSLKLDLRDNLLNLINKRFNIITNLGTTEHVGEDSNYEKLYEEQYVVFKNLHNLGENGCIYYNLVPFTKNWHKHGACDYSFNFFEKLCKECNYKIILSPEFELYADKIKKNRKFVKVIYQKINDDNFINFSKFKEISGIRTTHFD